MNLVNVRGQTPGSDQILAPEGLFVAAGQLNLRWMGVSGTGGRAFWGQLGQKEGGEAPIYLPRVPGGGQKALQGGLVAVLIPFKVLQGAPSGPGGALRGTF